MDELENHEDTLENHRDAINYNRIMAKTFGNFAGNYSDPKPLGHASPLLERSLASEPALSASEAQPTCQVVGRTSGNKVGQRDGTLGSHYGRCRFFVVFFFCLSNRRCCFSCF